MDDSQKNVSKLKENIQNCTDNTLPPPGSSTVTYSDDQTHWRSPERTSEVNHNVADVKQESNIAMNLGSSTIAPSVAEQRRLVEKIERRKEQARSTAGNSNQAQSSTTTGGRRKRHDCPICGRSFSDKHSVGLHVRTHTGEKPFACSICVKNFRQPPHFAKHLVSAAHKAKADKAERMTELLEANRLAEEANRRLEPLGTTVSIIKPQPSTSFDILD